MGTGGVERLRAAIDELTAADVRGLGQRDDVAELWWELARLEAQFSRRLGEFDLSVEWAVDGSRSAAGWLVKNVRAGKGEAYHRVKVARQTARMPSTRVAWEQGAISSGHVDALTRVRHGAKADKEFAVFEPFLVGVALAEPPEAVAHAGRKWRDALDDHLDRDGSKRVAGEQHVRRNVDFSRSISGIGFLDGVFDVEGAEVVETAFGREYERAHGADDARSPGQQRGDALVEICRHYLDGQGRGSNRPHILIPVDAATLAGEAVGRCETLSGYRVSPDTARRLACDAIIQRIVIGSDGVPLEMGRATRTFTPDQYRAIMLRDGGCRFPDCDAGPARCEAHHAVVHWEDGGPTDLANGLAVCRGSGHHRLIHEGGWTITGHPNGEITFHDPQGNERGTSRPRTPPTLLPTRTGTEITRTRERVHELQRARAA